jgi:YD repeat-containing protein
MKTIKNKFALVVFALFAVSCSSDDNNSPVHEIRENRITKEVDENTTTTFTYNASNQLIKIIEIGDLGFGTTQKVENYIYGTDGKVAEVVTDYTGSSSYGFKYAYSYNAGKLVTIIVKKYTGSGIYDNFSQIFFDYNTPNVVERAEFRQDGTTTRTVYSIANGNTTSYSVYTGVSANTPNGQLSYTNIYSNYDAKKTPYAGLPLVFHEPYLFVNNPGQTQSSGSTVNYTYQYNDDGYPTKKTMSFNSTSTSTTYLYERI